MPFARRRFFHRASIMAPIAALSIGCNDVIGIEDPQEIVAPDATFAIDAAADATNRGPQSDASANGSSNMPDAPAMDSGALPTQDAIVVPLPDGSTPTSDAPIVIRDSGSSGTTDSGRVDTGSVVDAGGTAVPDVRDAGIDVAAGSASATCQFSDVIGTSLDATPFETTSGDAKHKLDAGVDYIELNVMNFVRGVQRTLIIRMSSVPAAGTTLPFDDLNYLEYYEVKTGAGWSSRKAATPGGSVRVDRANGTSFTFTITGVKMGPMATATGTFTLNGSGSANPQ